jgi:hypothetical protein
VLAAFHFISVLATFHFISVLTVFHFNILFGFNQPRNCGCASYCMMDRLSTQNFEYL